MKNPHAVALGRLGGQAGSGQAKARTSEQARKAVQPVPFELGRFLVQSSSRPILHLVDLAYLPEGQRKAIAACSCEQNFDWIY